MNLQTTWKSIGSARKSADKHLASDVSTLANQMKLMVVGLGLLVAAFCVPLYQLARYSFTQELYSHVLLIPFISAYLAWQHRNEWTPSKNRDVPLAMIALIVGLGIQVGFWVAMIFGGGLSENDRLCLLIFSFVCLVVAWCLTIAGKENTDQLAFPLGVLFFMVPFPTIVLKGITMFLQVASADTAYGLIVLSGTPILRDGLFFTLPGLPLIEVAEECSGIRSTWVLLITSLLAGHLFLRRPWGKWLLAAAVIPIGILRNGFRILTITWLSVHVDPAIIEGPIHHRGGPIFFAVSLVPLLALLIFLRKRERRLGPQMPFMNGSTPNRAVTHSLSKP